LYSAFQSAAKVPVDLSAGRHGQVMIAPSAAAAPAPGARLASLMPSPPMNLAVMLCARSCLRNAEASLV
jgi:hypothetical protein